MVRMFRLMRFFFNLPGLRKWIKLIVSLLPDFYGLILLLAVTWQVFMIGGIWLFSGRYDPLLDPHKNGGIGMTERVNDDIQFPDNQPWWWEPMDKTNNPPPQMDIDTMPRHYTWRRIAGYGMYSPEK